MRGIHRLARGEQRVGCLGARSHEARARSGKLVAHHGMKLSVLDIADAIEETLVLAPHVESLGYERYWIAEHQPQPTPMLPVALVAGITDRLRVGTGGILFHYYDAQRAARDFQFLDRAFDGRIDAGLCGGLDRTLPAVELAGLDLRAHTARYHERVAQLVRELRDTPGEPPAIWALGAAPAPEHAAANGVGFAYSLLYGARVDDPAPVQPLSRALRRCARSARAACRARGLRRVHRPRGRGARDRRVGRR